MTDLPTSPPDSTPESQNQFWVALAIVGAMTVIGIGLIIAGLISSKWEDLTGGIGTIIGALATALNAPSGIGKVLSAAKSNPTPPTQGTNA